MTLVENGDLWADIRVPAMRETRPGLFLDRDGTLIELVDYLADPRKVTLLTDTVSEVRRANSAGIAVVIVTNQSGIGRGLYQWADFEAVQTRVIELLLEAGAKIDAVYACPHPPPDAGGPLVSAYRKPAPGMLMRASRDLGLDLATSRIIGDSVSDLAAGKAAGIPVGILAGTGHSERDATAVKMLADEEFEVNLF